MYDLHDHDYLKMLGSLYTGSDMFRSVWDRIHYDTDPLCHCLHGRILLVVSSVFGRQLLNLKPVDFAGEDFHSQKNGPTIFGSLKVRLSSPVVTKKTDQSENLCQVLGVFQLTKQKF